MAPLVTAHSSQVCNTGWCHDVRWTASQLRWAVQGSGPRARLLAGQGLLAVRGEGGVQPVLLAEAVQQLHLLLWGGSLHRRLGETATSLCWLRSLLPGRSLTARASCYPAAGGRSTAGRGADRGMSAAAARLTGAFHCCGFRVQAPHSEAARRPPEGCGWTAPLPCAGAPRQPPAAAARLPPRPGG